MNSKKNIKLNHLWKCNFIVITFLFFLSSCSNDGTSNPLGYDPGLPQALGKISEVIVVADQNVWEGPAGDTLRYYFGSAYLILPQPEPIFNIRHFTPDKLDRDKLFRQLKTYIFLGNLADFDSRVTSAIKRDIGETNSAKAHTDSTFHTVVGKNKWARDQMVAYIFGNSHDELADNVKASYPSLRKRIENHYQEQIGKKVFHSGRNTAVEKTIKEQFNVSMKIPKDFNILALNENNTIWVRKETSKISGNIFIKKIPYTSEDQFSQDGIRSLRDTFGRKHVVTDIPGAYMKSNDVDLPMFLTAVDLNGNYAMEARGIWDLVNDFMGGPFLSYLILNENTNELFYVEGFVHAPQIEKRPLMEEIHYILNQTKLGNSKPSKVSTEPKQ